MELNFTTSEFPDSRSHWFLLAANIGGTATWAKLQNNLMCKGSSLVSPTLYLHLSLSKHPAGFFLIFIYLRGRETAKETHSQTYHLLTVQMPAVAKSNGPWLKLGARSQICLSPWGPKHDCLDTCFCLLWSALVRGWS